MSTLVHHFVETARRHHSHTALRHRQGGIWRERTWADYAREARKVGKALVALGLPADGRVAILAGNRPEWMLAAIGTMFAGGAPVGIYNTLMADQVGYITAHAECTVAVVQDRKQAKKFREEPLPLLKKLILLDDAPEAPDELSWHQLMAAGDAISDEELDARWQARTADDLAVLIYTSGTTGMPKGVMLTHKNVTFAGQAAKDVLGITHEEHLLSYLPLSHIAEQVLSLHGPACIGLTISTCDEMSKLPDYLREVRPTVFFGVPRVWEKIQQKMMEAGRAASPVQKKIGAWARELGLEAVRARADHRREPLLYPLAKRLVFDRVRKRLGLDRCWMQVSGAAAISKDTLEYFASFDIPIYEVYGMSEVTGPGTLNLPHRFRLGTVGPAIPGTEVKLAPDGEILMRGPHVFKGYFKDPEATREALDPDGWIRSGDIGELDPQGFLRITDRKKDLFKTAGGKYIAPQALEARLKAIPGVGQAVVIGEGRKFAVALVTLDPDAWPGRPVAEVARDPQAVARLEGELARLNASLPSYETIKKMKVLPVEFSVEGGEMTPSLKIRRKVVSQKYAPQIEELYQGGGDG